MPMKEHLDLYKTCFDYYIVDIENLAHKLLYLKKWLLILSV